jgi:hypothetical protein
MRRRRPEKIPKKPASALDMPGAVMYIFEKF